MQIVEMDGKFGSLNNINAIRRVSQNLQEKDDEKSSLPSEKLTASQPVLAGITTNHYEIKPERNTVREFQLDGKANKLYLNTENYPNPLRNTLDHWTNRTENELRKKP